MPVPRRSCRVATDVPYGWLLLTLTFASYRLTRLVVHDTFPPVAWVRDRLTGDDPRVTRWRRVPEWVGALVSCTWCSSVWVSFGVTALTWVWIDIPVPLLTWGAVAGLSALVAHMEDYFTRQE